MTEQEFIDQMVASGYKDIGFYEVYDAHLFHKRLPSSVVEFAGCLTNDYKVSFEVRLHDPPMFFSDRPQSASIHITGEYAEDRWCELKIYSLTLEKMVENIKELEDDIASAWVGMVLTRRGLKGANNDS